MKNAQSRTFCLKSTTNASKNQLEYSKHDEANHTPTSARSQVGKGDLIITSRHKNPISLLPKAVTKINELFSKDAGKTDSKQKELCAEFLRRSLLLDMNPLSSVTA
jgi:hypothetical protein